MRASLPELSASVIHRLERHPWFQQARCVLLYYALPDEVDTRPLLYKYRDSKTLLLPSVAGYDLELHVYDSTSDMVQGAFHITQSQGPLVLPAHYSSIELAVIPGVAFDAAGHRLGRGRGYYDRLLPLLDCHTIGICFPFQLIESVPHEPHDMMVDEVISVSLPG